jgi:hypothetical protein
MITTRTVYHSLKYEETKMSGHGREMKELKRRGNGEKWGWENEKKRLMESAS